MIFYSFLSLLVLCSSSIFANMVQGNVPLKTCKVEATSAVIVVQYHAGSHYKVTVPDDFSSYVKTTRSGTTLHIHQKNNSQRELFAEPFEVDHQPRRAKDDGISVIHVLLPRMCVLLCALDSDAWCLVDRPVAPVISFGTRGVITVTGGEVLPIGGQLAKDGRMFVQARQVYASTSLFKGGGTLVVPSSTIVSDDINAGMIRGHVGHLYGPSGPAIDMHALINNHMKLRIQFSSRIESLMRDLVWYENVYHRSIASWYRDIAARQLLAPLVNQTERGNEIEQVMLHKSTMAHDKNASHPFFFAGGISSLVSAFLFALGAKSSSKGSGWYSAALFFAGTAALSFVSAGMKRQAFLSHEKEVLRPWLYERISRLRALVDLSRETRSTPLRKVLVSTLNRIDRAGENTWKVLRALMSLSRQLSQ